MTAELTPGASLPDTFRIPDQLIADWLKLPLSGELDVPFTRAIAEHLFFAIDKMARSQEQLQQCMIHISNSRMDDGNVALLASQRELVESQNRLRQFLMELIVGSTRK